MVRKSQSRLIQPIKSNDARHLKRPDTLVRVYRHSERSEESLGEDPSTSPQDDKDAKHIRTLKCLAPLGLWVFILSASTLYAADEVTALIQDSEGKKLSSVATATGDVPPQAEMDSKMLLPPPQEARADDVKKLILKIMIVNPSSKHQQKYPIKAALPSEIEPQHILSKEDLQVAFDSENGSYFLTQEVILDPGQSIVKTIEVEDIWRVSTETLTGLSEEAAGLMKKMQGTAYEEKARLLVQNTEVLLTQIYESQDDPNATPQEHIELFHENKRKIKEIELDLVALRRLVFEATGEKGIIKSGEGATGSFGFLGAGFRAEELAKNLSGAIPGWVAWRIIFVILGFLVLAAAVFYGIWAYQLQKLDQSKQGKSGATKFTPRSTEAIFQDVLDPGAKGSTPQDKERKAIEDLLPPAMPDTKPGKTNK